MIVESSVIKHGFYFVKIQKGNNFHTLLDEDDMTISIQTKKERALCRALVPYKEDRFRFTTNQQQELIQAPA